MLDFKWDWEAGISCKAWSGRYYVGWGNTIWRLLLTTAWQSDFIV